ncbi:MAG: 4Fe-4S binding protein, partial [Chloroflexi bacterium]|nr:4Fe-4S binding protein [Chloroflexota bacterium]
LDPTQSLQPTTKRIRDQKTLGFIKLRQKDMYAPRVRVSLGKIEADTLVQLSAIAKKYGRGYLRLTVRKDLEIPFVHFQDLEKVREETEALGLVLAGCGRTVRPIFVCMGNACPYSLLDVDALGSELEQGFFKPVIGLPHKFKISVTGCPIGCAKPQYNDVGFMGLAEPKLDLDECIQCGLCAEVCIEKAWVMDKDNNPAFYESVCIHCGDCLRICPTEALTVGRSGLAFFVGGKFGKHPMYGAKVAEFVPTTKAAELTDRTIRYFVEEGQDGERLAHTLNRLGLQHFKEKVVYPAIGRDYEPKSRVGEHEGIVGEVKP